MKICAIICEYNPFHNGHQYQLREAKRLSGADAILCIMSGNFVQRGEAAIMDKFKRAKHAILAGADIVIELPTVFATSNAELFARGAIHVLCSIPAVTTLCFGCENANKEAFISAAKKLNNEPEEISLKIKELVASGMSYAKARATAWSSELPPKLLTSPNNILGVEYTKALLNKISSIEILPIKRIGSAYNDNKMQENFSSASAIRASIENKTEMQGNLPNFVLNDFPEKLDKNLDILEKYAILSRSAKEIASVCDCKEGLENAFKKATLSNELLTKTLTSSRYTASRIRRIALQNLLNIKETDIRNSLQAPLYLRVLGIKKERLDLLTVISDSSFPLLVRSHDEKNLQEAAKMCLNKDIYAEKIYGLLYQTNVEKNIFIGN